MSVQRPGMKVLQVTPTYYPATYWGGPIFSTHALCNALATRHDIELRVLTTDAAGPKRAQRLKADAFPTRFPAGYDVYFTRRILLGNTRFTRAAGDRKVRDPAASRTPIHAGTRSARRAMSNT
jgi:hypothetical protein